MFLLVELIDEHNKFITILMDNFTFKDSFRIFPVSLKDLCKIFNVEGKLANI